jgi:hypothetical protein
MCSWAGSYLAAGETIGETVWPGWSAAVIFGHDTTTGLVGLAPTRAADPKSRSPWRFCDPVSTAEAATADAAVPTRATPIAMVALSNTIPAGNR